MAVIAVAALLLLMGRLAAPAPSPAPTLTQTERQPAQAVEDRPEVGPDLSREEVVAVVNDQTITKQVWQQATRLDAVMSRLASQPIPTAEETLGRLVNEIIVLATVKDLPAPDDDEVAAKISALAAAWNLSDEAITTALAEVGLNRADLAGRVGRLIQVEAALNQLAAQEDDLDAWLAEARASARIGLYRPLANAALAPASPQVVAANEQPVQSEPIAEPRLPVSNKAEIFAPPPDMPVSPYPENAAPDFTLTQLNGDPLTLSDFRGKPTIINFWATWCPPCRVELPALQAAYDKYSPEIGFVAVDLKESSSTVAPFVEQMGLTFPIVIDSDGRVSDAAYQVRGIPTTIFVDAYGVISARHVGPLDEALIESYLTPLLPPPVEQPAAGNLATPPVVTINNSAASVEVAQNSASTSMGGTAHNAAGSNQTIPQQSADLPLAPDFTLNSAAGLPVSLKDYRNKSNVVLVFYRGYT